MRTCRVAIIVIIRRTLPFTYYSISFPFPCTGYHGFRESSSAPAPLRPLFTDYGPVLVPVPTVLVMVGWRDGVLG